MITATETDTNIPAVMKEAKLYNLITKQSYHVQGLRRENNAVVLIEYAGCYADADFIKRLDSLTKFFKLNNIEIEISNESNSRRIDIGLRIDLRQTLNRNKKPLLAASILLTVIYCLEDRIDIEQMKKHKLPSIPKFVHKTNITSRPTEISGSPGQMCDYGWWDKTMEEKILKAMKDNSNINREQAITLTVNRL